MEKKWFKYNATGNYSHAHNWDGGLETLRVEQGYNPQDDEFYHEYIKIKDGFYWCSNSYGGSHSVYGFIFAHSKEEADIMLRIELGMN